MKTRLQQRIVAMRREGYRIWKIAEMARVSVEDVTFALVEAGLIDEQIAVATANMKCERKPERLQEQPQ